MVKKVSITVISLVILIAGIIALNNLHYWERSVEIFKINNESTEERNFEGRHGNFDRRGNRDRLDGRQDDRERLDFRNMPDSVRQRIITGGNLQSFPDSLRHGRSRTLPGDWDTFEGRSIERGGHRGGNFRRGDNIQIGTVTWFLAVFALFTLVTVYLDKSYNLIRRKNNGKNTE